MINLAGPGWASTSGIHWKVCRGGCG